MFRLLMTVSPFSNSISMCFNLDHECDHSWRVAGVTGNTGYVWCSNVKELMIFYYFL